MVWLSSSLFLPFLEENSYIRSMGAGLYSGRRGAWKHLINPLIPVPSVGLSERLTLMVRLPHNWENIQRSQLNLFLSCSVQTPFSRAQALVHAHA